MRDILLTTITNTTVLFLLACFSACAFRYAGHREADASAWVRRRFTLVAKSKLLLCVLACGCALGVGSHFVVGYLGPGDIAQEFIGAKEFEAGRSINPTTSMHSKVDYWLSREPDGTPWLDQFPALQRLQAASINSGARQLFAQAHPPFHILTMAPVVELCGSLRRTYLAMTLINVTAYSGLLFLLWRATKLNAVVPAGGTAILLLLAFEWQPFLANLRQGQIGIVVAVLIIGGWHCLSRERPWMAGMLIGVATLIKMFPALLIVWLLLRNRKHS